MSERRDAVASTAELMARARGVLAYGGFDGLIQRPLHHGDGTYPQFAVAADGCRITDTTGRRYLDWSNGWGPVILGHRHPVVEAAITHQLSAGPTLPLMHPVEVEVAEQICDLVPSAEMVAFGKNGSDAVAAAVRVARAATGRPVILQHGFHGYHDWYVAKFEDVLGVPDSLRDLVVEFPYDDLDALEAAFDAHRGEVAAVMMEPVNTFEPSPGYLAGVRDLAHHHGALLVFDEVMTAFRVGRGGAQARYGVTPDLTCLGKAMANGMPLSAVAGRRELMALVPSVGYGITFRGETLSLAAAKATLGIITEEPVTEHLERVGLRVRHAFEPRSRELGLPCRLLGPPARQTIAFEPTKDHDWQVVRDRFLRACLRRGVLTTGVLLPNYAHDDEAVDETITGLIRALEDTCDELDADVVGRIDLPFGGSPDGPPAHTATGFVEVLRTVGRHLEVIGWLQIDGAAPREVRAEFPDGSHLVFTTDRRPDLDRFVGRLPLRSLGTDRGRTFVLVATSEVGRTWRCAVQVTTGALPTPVPVDTGTIYA